MYFKFCSMDQKQRKQPKKLRKRLLRGYQFYEDIHKHSTIRPFSDAAKAHYKEIRAYINITDIRLEG